jgi:hypothetical protein
MRTTGISATPGGTPAATGSWNLTTGEEGAFRPFFRQLAYLRIATGGLAHRAVVDAAATRIAGSFGPIDHDALATPDYVTLTAIDGSTVLAVLPVPERILRLQRTLAPPPSPTRSAYVHRVDSSTPGPSPAAAATYGTSFGAEVVDLRFALRVGQSTTSFDALAPGGVGALWMRSIPSSPRLSLAPAGDLSAAIGFWAAPGEIGRGQPASAGIFAIQSAANGPNAFADALGRLLDSLPSPLPATIDLALIAESDAPCTFALTQVEVGGRFVRAGFAVPAGATVAPEKQVLRFDGGAVRKQEVVLEIPRGAAIASAALELSASLRDDRPADASVPAGSLADTGLVATLGEDDLTVGAGATLRVGRWAAQAFTPPAATVATGVALGMLPLAEATEVRVELREDHNGSPAGRVLADATVAAGPAGSRAWGSARFAEAVILPVQPYWVVVSARNGAGVWLARDATGKLQLGPTDTDGKTSAADGALDGLEGLHRLLQRPPEPATTGGGSGGGDPTAPVALPIAITIGASAVQPAGPPGDRASADITAALADALAAAPGTDALVPIPVAVSTPVAGLVTVYPPTVEYTVE